jgi:hypothetical protein
VAAGVLAATRAQTLIMNVAPGSDAAALREIVADLVRLPDANRHLAGLMSGLSIRYDLGDPDPLVGSRMPDLALETAEGSTTVSTLLRTGHGLFLELGDPGPVAVVDRPARVVARAVDSPAGTDLGGADRVLVRPDGYVGWTGSGREASPVEALRRWFGNLEPSLLKVPAFADSGLT